MHHDTSFSLYFFCSNLFLNIGSLLIKLLNILIEALGSEFGVKCAVVNFYFMNDFLCLPFHFSAYICFVLSIPYLFWLMFYGIVVVILDICLFGMTGLFIMYLLLVLCRSWLSL